MAVGLKQGATAKITNRTLSGVLHPHRLFVLVAGQYRPPDQVPFLKMVLHDRIVAYRLCKTRSWKNRGPLEQRKTTTFQCCSANMKRDGRFQFQVAFIMGFPHCLISRTHGPRCAVLHGLPTCIETARA